MKDQTLHHMEAVRFYSLQDRLPFALVLKEFLDMPLPVASENITVYLKKEYLYLSF